MNLGKIKLDPLAKELLQGVTTRPISRQERIEWDKLMQQHHYLGYRGFVGESIRYIAESNGRWVALIGWASAAFQCEVRDKWIGWPPIIKNQRLRFIANNTRFLILPGIHIPNLASRILALNLKRLSQDWTGMHGHPIYLAETFVDYRYFKGTCYKAAGWTFLGYTKGYSKSSHGYIRHNKPKMIFVRTIGSRSREYLNSPEFSLERKKELKPMKLSLKNAETLTKFLLQIPEHRKPRGVRHRRRSILAVSICAIMCNAWSFAAIAEWGGRCSQNMLKRLSCRYNTKTKQYIPPSEPTIRRFLQNVDAESVDKALSSWFQSICDKDSPIAVDGKTLCGARQSNGKQVHLLSAFLHEQGMVLAQTQVDRKTNEIPMVPILFDDVDLQGRVVTFDALHTQKETARYLVEDKKADYVFTVKGNQKTLKQDIVDLNLNSFPPSTHNN
jgi:hypothetical protein